jgi:CRISPR/Cas system CSM-associated protein Csm3 (group 7 of RAMP superfamily)
MTLTLQLDFKSLWRAGTGLARGEMDDSSARDSQDGLPVFPGKQLKGILKDAVHQSQQLGWLSTDNTKITEQLFGRDGRDGMLRVDTAQLIPTQVEVFKQNPELSGQLFRAQAATRINKLGVTEQGALRKTETVVPLTLVAEVSLVSGKIPTDGDWADHIRAALPLIRSVGANRSRGLGRVSITEQGSQAVKT